MYPTSCQSSWHLLPSIWQLLEAFKLCENELNMGTPVSFRQPWSFYWLLLDTCRIFLLHCSFGRWRCSWCCSRLLGTFHQMEYNCVKMNSTWEHLFRFANQEVYYSTLAEFSFCTAHSVDGAVAGAVVDLWGHITKWIPIVVQLKRTAFGTFCKFLEARNVGLVEWKWYFCVAWYTVAK